MTETVLHYIDGKATKGASSRVMDVYNPPSARRKVKSLWERQRMWKQLSKRPEKSSLVGPPPRQCAARA